MSVSKKTKQKLSSKECLENNELLSNLYRQCFSYYGPKGRNRFSHKGKYLTGPLLASENDLIKCLGVDMNSKYSTVTIDEGTSPEVISYQIEFNVTGRNYIVKIKEAVSWMWHFSHYKASDITVSVYESRTEDDFQLLYSIKQESEHASNKLETSVYLHNYWVSDFRLLEDEVSRFHSDTNSITAQISQVDRIENKIIELQNEEENFGVDLKSKIEWQQRKLNKINDFYQVYQKKYKFLFKEESSEKMPVGRLNKRFVVFLVLIIFLIIIDFTVGLH